MQPWTTISRSRSLTLYTVLNMFHLHTEDVTLNVGLDVFQHN